MKISEIVHDSLYNQISETYVSDYSWTNWDKDNKDGLIRYDSASGQAIIRCSKCGGTGKQHSTNQQHLRGGGTHVLGHGVLNPGKICAQCDGRGIVARIPLEVASEHLPDGKFEELYPDVYQFIMDTLNDESALTKNSGKTAKEAYMSLILSGNIPDKKLSLIQNFLRKQRGEEIVPFKTKTDADPAMQYHKNNPVDGRYRTGSYNATNMRKKKSY